MHITLIVLAVFAVIAVVFLTMGSDPAAKRRQALQNLAKLLSSQLETIEGYENSFRISFKYQGRECVYEDMEEKGFQGRVFQRGLLKIKTATNFTLGFSEQNVGSVKENVESFADISNPWAQNLGRLFVPKSLERFTVFSNNHQLANTLFLDETAMKAFERFKNVDSRGHPVMSLDFSDGVMVLKFHGVGNLQPSLINFHGNISSIEEYLTKLSVLADRVEVIARDLKLGSL